MADSVIFGFIVSAVVIAVIFLIAHALVRTDGGNFLNIIRAEYWVPSLSLFQFLLWTIVISFSYIWISSIRIFEGDLSFSTTIPSNLYLLLGISVAVPLISVSYTKSAYKPETPAKPPEKLPPFGMMLKNKGKIALNRFQMFLWTIIGVVLYRPLFRPLVFEKDSVRAFDMKKTDLPVPRWVFAIFYLLLVSAVFFSMTWGEVLRLTSGQGIGADFVFHLLIVIGIVAFLLELCYRSFARMHYPGFLKVTLKTGEILYLYTEHPENLAAMLGADT